MTHDEAIKDGATERYVLDELTDEERDAFEAHYFDCAVCAEDVKAAIAVRDGFAADQVLVDPVVVPFEHRQRKLPATLAAAASAMIAVVSMYATVVQPQRKQLAEALVPVVVASDEIDLAANRGPEDLTEPGDHRESVLLKIDLETHDQSPRYNLRVFDSAGRQQFTTPVDGKTARSRFIRIPIRGGLLKAGTYTLRVDGTEAGVATYRFTLR